MKSDFYNKLKYKMANKEEQLETGAVIGAETFRDSVSTVDQSGARKWVYPKNQKENSQLQRHSYGLFISRFFVVPLLS